MPTFLPLPARELVTDALAGLTELGVGGATRRLFLARKGAKSAGGVGLGVMAWRSASMVRTRAAASERSFESMVMRYALLEIQWEMREVEPPSWPCVNRVA